MDGPTINAVESPFERLPGEARYYVSVWHEDEAQRREFARAIFTTLERETDWSIETDPDDGVLNLSRLT